MVKNMGDICTSSVTFQFDMPFAGGFYRRFFPRVRQTADIHESWILIRSWARLKMPGDRQGKGATYTDALRDTALEPHFRKLDADGSGQLSRTELSTIFRKGELLAALGWHDEDGDGSVSLEEFKQGFAFWSAITHEAIAGTPKKWQKFHLHGTIENLEDLP